MHYLFDGISRAILIVCLFGEHADQTTIHGRALTWWHKRVCSPYDRWYIRRWYPNQSTYDDQ